MASLQRTRDKSLHDPRRRVWSGAFGDRNMRDYEKRMVWYRALLVNAIDESKNQPFDVTKWFNLYTFDVMGDLAFGASFGMFETSKEHEGITFGLHVSRVVLLVNDGDSWNRKGLVEIYQLLYLADGGSYNGESNQLQFHRVFIF